jgi:proteic killer suppression protein
MAILSFKGRWTELIYSDRIPRGFPADVVVVARRKLLMLNQARQLGDLLAVRGNRLEALKGNRRGQHSIRINDQWRICFEWRDGNAEKGEIVDYH